MTGERKWYDNEGIGGWRTVLRKVGACITNFDELGEDVRCSLCQKVDVARTPVPLSTTRGIDGSMVEAGCGGYILGTANRVVR